ncbi:hypothetical protein CA54_45500 [Symmachiella macrocystis]|uniref:Uncharacterized protein n=1 Tax=Symmachiella macrocystis TaxID=2527985 RepID=A0A5C6BBE7_9PLAN|nr:hypothetical protein [Symmachiella macrocystis]TWU09310.1 hypothetical protein CA54_45500 [Symmachiella macrocystis]
MPSPLGGDWTSGLMHTDQQTLEQIVAAVVKKHLAAPVEMRPAETAETAVSVTYLSDAIITADLLKEQINGDRRFQISAQAILTPSARDLIREQGLTWTRVTAASTVTSATFLAAVVTAGPQVMRAMEQLGGDWKLELQESPASAARLAVSAVSRGEYAGVAIVSGQPRLAACLANRSPKIRATVVSHSEDVATTMNEMGANVIALDPANIGMFAMKTLLQRFSKQKPHPPANWETTSRLW